MKAPLTALEQALKLLKSKDLSTQELRDRLAARGYGEEETENALGKLKDYHYVDDQRTAEREAERLAKELAGQTKIQHRLETRGLEVPEIETPDELTKALTLLRSRLKPGDPWTRAARILNSQGYDEETIREALERTYPDRSD